MVRTIADIAADDRIATPHLAEAIQYPGSSIEYQVSSPTIGGCDKAVQGCCYTDSSTKYRRLK